MMDNIPIENKARDKAWAAFIKRKGTKDMFPQEFKFPLDRGYYEMWCQCWAEAWDAGFKDGYEAGESGAQKPMIATLNGREVVMGTVRMPGSTKDRPGWVYKDTGEPVYKIERDPRMPLFEPKK